MQTAVQTIIQEGIVLLLVSWSIWQVLRRFAARPLYLVQSRLAVMLQQRGWLRLAAYLMPVAPTVAGCSQGCGSCSSSPVSSCSTQAASPVDTADSDPTTEVGRPVQWR